MNDNLKRAHWLRGQGYGTDYIAYVLGLSPKWTRELLRTPVPPAPTNRPVPSRKNLEQLAPGYKNWGREVPEYRPEELGAKMRKRFGEILHDVILRLNVNVSSMVLVNPDRVRKAMQGCEVSNLALVMRYTLEEVEFQSQFSETEIIIQNPEAQLLYDYARYGD